MSNTTSYVSFSPEKSEYNDFKQETYQEKLFSSLINLLATPRGSHPYDPNYGVGLSTYLLQNDTGNLASQMENDVTTTIRNYIPELTNYTKVYIEREFMKDGIGYKYNMKVIVQNVIINFNILKNGTLMYTNTQM